MLAPEGSIGASPTECGWREYSLPASSSRRAPIHEMKRSGKGIVVADVGVKGWFALTPDVDAVRPARCPWCDAASRPVGERLGLHGHGIVERQLWGPTEIDGAPQTLVLKVRRYLCTMCGQACCVVPRGVIRCLYYSALAIGLGLALWAVEGRSSLSVHGCVSPLSIVGNEARRGWRSLARWTRAIVDGRLLGVGPLSVSGTPRPQASAVATALAGYASPSDRQLGLPSRAALGAAQVA